MIIPISIAPPSSTNPKLHPSLAKISHDEFVLIELQGALEVECNDPSERNAKLVGRLKIDDNTNKPTLRIGHHLLEGKIASLPKPLAVLYRSKAPGTTTVGRDQKQALEDDEMMDVDFDAAPGNGESQDQNTTGDNVVGWDIVAVVKRKIVFSKRPMPIVGQQS